MEIDSVSSTSNSSVRDNLLVQHQDQASRRRKKLKFIITLIIIFSLIIACIFSVFTIMKKNFELESPAKNPVKAIKSVCSLTPYPQTCFTSLYNNTSTKNINASQIFSFSLHTAIDELTQLSTESKHCKEILINSVHHLNRSLATLDMVDFGNEKSFVISKSLRELMGWLYREEPKIDACLYINFRARKARNSLRILSNMDSVSEMLPGVNESQEMLASFLSDITFVDTICFVGAQYIVLLFLFCLLVRLL